MTDIRWEPDYTDTYAFETACRQKAERYRSEPMVLTTGKIPEADICFLDEAFKCNDGVLNSLLTALNERKYTNEGRTYAVPAVHKKVEIFKGERFNERELERQLSQSDSIRRLMNARSSLDRADKRPLLPLSIGQIGLVGGSGMINGLIDCGTPHIIKGRIIKVKTEERKEMFSSQGIHVGAEIKEVISNKMVFNVLTPKGFKALT